MITTSLNKLLNETYDIIEILGTGGGGTVYKAWHKRLGKYVVIKELPHSRFCDEESRRNEVEALKNVKSAHLPQVYDFFSEPCCSYTIMEFIDGESFMTLLNKNQKFTEHRVMDWYGQLASVLEDLHALDICHGDIKPTNIMLMPNGRACLIDFNVAIVEGNNTRIVSRSRGYASPEQYNLFTFFKNKDKSKYSNVDWKLSDIHNLGATMYHILMGRRMRYDTKGRVMQANFNTKGTKGMGPILSPCQFIIQRSTHPNPGSRFASATALRRTIQSVNSKKAF